MIDKKIIAIFAVIIILSALATYDALTTIDKFKIYEEVMTKYPDAPDEQTYIVYWYCVDDIEGDEINIFEYNDHYDYITKKAGLK